MDLYCGAKIKLQLKNNDVMIGYINSINTNEEDGILTISKVDILQNGDPRNKTRLPGVQLIQASSINELEVLPESESVMSDKKRNEKLTGGNIKHSKRIPDHLKLLTELEPEKLIFGGDRKGSKSALSKEDELIKSVFKEGSNSDDESVDDVEDSYSTDEFTVLTKTDQLFHDAIQFITDRPVIGFAAEGVDMGRDGKLCWIQIDAGGSLFLFDMVNLREDGLKNGLMKIIQSETILKVVHDCRLISDLLFHQFKIQMLNIFDTQVAHVLAYREQNRKDLPRYVPGLASCLHEHLDLPEEQIHVIRFREQAKSEDQEVWAERPAAPWLLDAASKHVKHLLDLRMILMEKMMVEFIAGVEIYLTYVRNSSDKEAKDCQSKRHLLPIAFQHLHNFVHDLTKRMRYNNCRKRNEPRLKDPHGFRENRVEISDPLISASKDSIWHYKVDRRKKITDSQPEEKEQKEEKLTCGPKEVTKIKESAIRSEANQNCDKIKAIESHKVVKKELFFSENNKSRKKESSKERRNIFPPKPFEKSECAEQSGSDSVSSPDSESDLAENLGTQLSDRAFIEQISLQADMQRASPSPEKFFTSLRQKTVANSLSGITLLPAGLIQENKKKKTYEENFYDQLYADESPQQSEVSEEDDQEYGEIPSQQKLGRAAQRTLPLFPLSKDQSMSTSSVSSLSSISSKENSSSPIKHHNSYASINNETTNNFAVCRNDNNSPNINHLSFKQMLPRQRSYSSLSSVVSTGSSTTSTRHQQLVEILKSPK